MKKRILVTGGAGFIGSYLCEALLEKGYKVTILDNLSTGKYQNIAHLEENPDLDCVIDTVLNETTVEDLIKNCDAIYHLAAAVGVKLIVDEPIRTIETNILGTEIVLKYASRYRKKTLTVSTSEVYGKSEAKSFSESQDCLYGPTTNSRWLYASSKAVDEFLALAHWRERKLPVVIVRLFNTVGARQTGRYGMVIPRFVSQALAGKPLTVYADGKQSRCFADVRDVVPGMLALMESQKTNGEIYNIGNDSEITIEALAQKVIDIVGSSSKIEYVPYEKVYGKGFEDIQRRKPNLEKIKNTVGYTPKINLEETIQSIIEYQKKNPDAVLL